MTDTYQAWVERVVAGRENKPLEPNEIVKSSSGQPYNAINFVTVQKNGFKVEIGKKGADYIFHFFPKDEATVWQFKGPLEDAFLEVFKNPEQIEADWVEEFQSFAVRVRGFVHNVWGDELALRAVDVLEKKLGE